MARTWRTGALEPSARRCVDTLVRLSLLLSRTLSLSLSLFFLSRHPAAALLQVWTKEG